MSWTEQAVLRELRALVLQHTEATVELTPRTELVAELGIDSLGVMELVADVEDEFGLTITDGELRDVVTFGDVSLTIVKMLREAGKLDEADASGVAGGGAEP